MFRFSAHMFLTFGLALIVLAFVFESGGHAVSATKKKTDAQNEVTSSTSEQEGKEQGQQRSGWEGSELRFVTDSDYPPFNYLDEEGVLTGFNIDLARAICLELEVRCDIQARDWDEHQALVERGQADAVISSLAINKRNLQMLDFTNRYFQMPARFITHSEIKIKDAKPELLSGYHIGVMAMTAHEAYLRDFFSSSKIKVFQTTEELQKAIKAKEIDFIFGDGVGLMFWLNGLESGGCCRFVGGSFTESKYFGEGVGIGVKKGNVKLKNAINQALDKVRTSGRYEELILRYFPLRFY